MSLRCEFRVVMSVTIATKNDVRLYLQLLAGGFMSDLRYLCLFAHIGVKHILSCFLFCLSLSCLPYVVGFSGLSILDCPFGIL